MPSRRLTQRAFRSHQRSAVPAPPLFPTTSSDSSAWPGGPTTFETQREEFATERQEQFKKSLGNVELLMGKSHPDYAIDAASREPICSPTARIEFRKETVVSITSIKRFDHPRRAIRQERAMGKVAADLFRSGSSIEPADPALERQAEAVATRSAFGCWPFTRPTSSSSFRKGTRRSRDEVEALLQVGHAAFHPTRPGSRFQPTSQARRRQGQRQASRLIGMRRSTARAHGHAVGRAERRQAELLS